MHWAGLVPAVGDGVEQVAHAGVLHALLCGAEVVIHHLVDYFVRDAAATICNPERTQNGTVTGGNRCR